MISANRTTMRHLSGMKRMVPVVARAASARTSGAMRSFFAVNPNFAAASATAGGARRGTFPAWSRAMSSLPSHVTLTFPALSPTMTAGTICESPNHLDL